MVNKETLEAAIGGNDDAYIRVIEDSIPTIRNAFKASKGRTMQTFDTVDDAINSFIADRFEAIIHGYDFAIDANFDTYLSACVKNYIISEYRTAGRQKRNTMTCGTAQDMESLIEPVEPNAVEFTDKSLLLDVVDSLSGIRPQVIKMYYGLGDQPQLAWSEIARELGIGRNKMYKELGGAIVELRGLLMRTV